MPKRDRRLYGRLYMREYAARWRKAVLAALGDRCVRCGFADPRALQVDHVHGGGAKDALARNRNIAKYYRKVIAAVGSGQFQLLCANCNWIKRAENNEVRRLD